MRASLLPAALTLALAAGSAQAAEINVFTAGAVQEAEHELAAAFTKETGHTVKFTAGTVGQIQDKLKEGGPVDVIVVASPSLEQMQKAGTVTGADRKSTRLNSSHVSESRMPSSA